MKLLLLAALILGAGVVGVILIARPTTRNATSAATPAPGAQESVGTYSAVIVSRSSSPDVVPQMETPEQRHQRIVELNRAVYLELGEALGLDAAGEAQLLEVLMDHNTGLGNPVDALDALEEKREAPLEALLGPDGPQRFNVYFESLTARRSVLQVNERLGEDDKIRGASKERLIALVHTGTRPESQDSLPSSFQTMPPEVAGSQRSEVLASMAASEDYFRLQHRSHRRMEREAAKFLKPAQLEAFVHANAEEDRSWRAGLEDSRREVGLEPVVPENPEATFGPLRRRVPLAGDVSFELTLAVDGRPTHFSHTGPNRQTIGFQAANDVWVEAIPILYDDQWLEMYLTYFEPVRKGRRPLDQTVRIGTQTILADGTRAAPHDAVIESLTGRRTYQIQATGITARRIF